MSAKVGIVIVSHSPDVAKGAADMVRQMVGNDVPLAHCGGNPDGGLGTSVEKIMAAIDAAWSEAGVAILVDLGGAETNSEMAIEILPPERQSKVVICNAPVVEGAVMAATEAWGGGSLAEVKAHRRGAFATMSGWLTGNIVITHAVGLHARPSVKLTKTAKGFAANIEIAANGDGPWVDAKSIVKVMALKVPQHSILFVRATGDSAEAAVSAIIALVSNDFEDGNAHLRSRAPSPPTGCYIGPVLHLDGNSAGAKAFGAPRIGSCGPCRSHCRRHRRYRRTC